MRNRRDQARVARVVGLQRSGGTIWTVLSLVLSGVGSGGCIAATVETELRIVDPTQVALTQPSGSVVIPEGSSEISAPLGEGRSDTHGGGSTAYAVEARREADESLAVEWKTQVALNNGERQTVLPANGKLDFRGPASNVFPARMFSLPRFELGACTFLGTAYSGGKYSHFTGHVVQPFGCLGDNSGDSGRDHVSYVLTTDWKNVEIIQRTTWERTAAWLGIGLGGAIFGGGGTVILFTDKNDWQGGNVGKYSMAALCYGTMLLFDAWLVPVLFKHDKAVHIGPGSPPPLPAP
jgi:hypothetical protein